MEIVEGQTTFVGDVTKADKRFDAHIADLKTREARRKAGNDHEDLGRTKAIEPPRRKKIAIHATALISEERTLQELRYAHKLTQKRMAEVRGIGQDSVSRLESAGCFRRRAVRDNLRSKSGLSGEGIEGVRDQTNALVRVIIDVHPGCRPPYSTIDNRATG